MQDGGKKNAIYPLTIDPGEGWRRNYLWVGKGFLNYLIWNDVFTFKEEMRGVYKRIFKKKNVNAVSENWTITPLQSQIEEGSH